LRQELARLLSGAGSTYDKGGSWNRPARGKTCNLCGMTGHLAATCTVNRKKHVDKCTWCHRHGHVVSECKKKMGYDAAKASVPNAPTPKGSAWGKSQTAAAAKEPTVTTWKCSNTLCNIWHTDAVSKCKCGKHRLKDKDDKKKEVVYLSCSKQGQEVLGRLCTQEDGDDVAMASADYTLPADQMELVQKRLELTEQLEKLIAMGVHQDAVNVVKAQLAKLPKPSANQPVQDWACLTAQQLHISKEYRKKADLCEKKKNDIEQEKKDRAAELCRELAEATKQHEARMEAISTQHAIHLADTMVREEANLAMSADLEEQHAKIMEEIRAAIEAAAPPKKEATEPTAVPPAVTRPPPPTMNNAPAMPVITAEGVMAQMAASNSFAVPQEQAAAFAAMMNAMLTAAMMPVASSSTAVAAATTLPATAPDAGSLVSREQEELGREVESLNGGGKPAPAPRTSNRVAPFSKV
jgi:hypothetical protein